MTTATVRRVLIALSLPVHVTDLSKLGHSFVAAMTNNAYFPSPVPPLPTLDAQLKALDAAETATKLRTTGTVPARNGARTAVVSSLHTLKAYVQTIADADPEKAAEIIASAGMVVKKSAKRAAPSFEARQGTVSGSVRLSTKAAAARASYDWEWSADGGKTWTPVPSTLKAKTIVTGIPVGTNAQFRFRAITKTGETDWSQIVTLLVK